MNSGVRIQNESFGWDKSQRFSGKKLEISDFWNFQVSSQSFCLFPRKCSTSGGLKFLNLNFLRCFEQILTFETHTFQISQIKLKITAFFFPQKHSVSENEKFPSFLKENFWGKSKNFRICFSCKFSAFGTEKCQMFFKKYLESISKFHIFFQQICDFWKTFLLEKVSTFFLKIVWNYSNSFRVFWNLLLFSIFPFMMVVLSTLSYFPIS